MSMQQCFQLEAALNELNLDPPQQFGVVEESNEVAIVSLSNNPNDYRVRLGEALARFTSNPPTTYEETITVLQSLAPPA